MYKDISTDLKSGKTVLFIELPYDTFAVKKYTEKYNDTGKGGNDQQKEISYTGRIYRTVPYRKSLRYMP